MISSTFFSGQTDKTKKRSQYLFWVYHSRDGKQDGISRGCNTLGRDVCSFPLFTTRSRVPQASTST